MLEHSLISMAAAYVAEELLAEQSEQQKNGEDCIAAKLQTRSIIFQRLMTGWSSNTSMEPSPCMMRRILKEGLV